MDECFDDVSIDTGASDSLDIGTDFDLPASESLDIDVEPFVDIPVEESFIDSFTDIEPPISEPELAELENEAAALEIEPLDDGIDLGYNYDEAIEEANAQWAEEEQAYEPSTLENIINAGASGATSPSELAQIGSSIVAPYGAEDVTAQGLQAAANAAVVGAEGLMGAAERQHGSDFPREGIDYIRNESGEIEPLAPMVQTTDDNGESVWVRPSNDITDG